VDDDITLWIRQLSQGDESAAQRIWNQYCEQLIRLARNKLANAPRRAADEEDVTVSAFHSFCRGVAAGRFPRLDDREDLWKLLIAITANKAVDQLRREHAQKRGGGAVRGESVLMGDDSSSRQAGIGEVLGNEPTPEFAAMVKEDCELMLDSLGDDTLRRVARYKLEGYTNKEIAAELECVVATVERKLQRIRSTWLGRGSS